MSKTAAEWEYVWNHGEMLLPELIQAIFQAGAEAQREADAKALSALHGHGPIYMQTAIKVVNMNPLVTLPKGEV